MRTNHPNCETPMCGAEVIRLQDACSPTTVLGFWSWALSDVYSNTTRGLLAEFFVACDLCVVNRMRIEWEPFDLTTKAGIRVEVKSSAFLQRWEQKCETKPDFSVAPTKLWDPVLGKYVGERKRRADVYVFCLHAHRSRETLNPLDITQWQFFVAPTRLLNARLTPDQRKVRLSTLAKIGATEVAFGSIDSTISLLVRGGDEIGLAEPVSDPEAPGGLRLTELRPLRS